MLARGEQVRVEGRGFVDGCDDTGGGDAFGCTHDEPEPVIPRADVELRLSSGAVQAENAPGVVLGRADAGTADDDRLGQVVWTVVVPTDAPPGRALLDADGAELEVVVS